MILPMTNLLRISRTGSEILKRLVCFAICIVMYFLINCSCFSFIEEFALLFVPLAIFEMGANQVCGLIFQHASSDVEKMVLGNKCDMEDRRLVSKERGTQVNMFVQCSKYKEIW